MTEAIGLLSICESSLGAGVTEMKKSDKKVKIRIFAFPMEGCDPSKTWKAASEMIAKRLSSRYGNRIQVEFIEIFSPESFDYPEILELIQNEQVLPPIITVEGKVVHNGGKLSERVLREELEKIGIFSDPQP